MNLQKLLLCIIVAGMALQGALAQNEPAGAALILVVGAPGEEQFATNFTRQAELWQNAAAKTVMRTVTIGLEPGDGSDRQRLEQTLGRESRQGPDPLWVVLIGHGTFDGKQARFNLRGPDFTATELGQWLKDFERPTMVINTASASSPFLKALAATNRVVITATRSGNEQNFTRLGQFLAEAITNPEADLDKDEQVSLLEAFLTASKNVGRDYRQFGKLLTEHALIDDTGDGLGTSADWYRGLRATKKPTEGAAVDGRRARQAFLVPGEQDRALTPEQRQKRDELEQAIFALREKKDQMPEPMYYRQLETLLLSFARLHLPPQPAASETETKQP